MGRHADQHLTVQNGSTHQPPGYHLPSAPHQFSTQTPLPQPPAHQAGALHEAGTGFFLAACETPVMPPSAKDAMAAANKHFAAIFRQSCQIAGGKVQSSARFGKFAGAL